MKTKRKLSSSTSVTPLQSSVMILSSFVPPKRRSRIVRVRWNDELERKFLIAVEKLRNQAVPSRILAEMSVPYLTRDQVASHLQKFRLQNETDGGEGGKEKGRREGREGEEEEEERSVRREFIFTDETDKVTCLHLSQTEGKPLRKSSPPVNEEEEEEEEEAKTFRNNSWQTPSSSFHVLPAPLSHHTQMLTSSSSSFSFSSSSSSSFNTNHEFLPLSFQQPQKTEEVTYFQDFVEVPQSYFTSTPLPCSCTQCISSASTSVSLQQQSPSLFFQQQLQTQQPHHPHSFTTFQFDDYLHSAQNLHYSFTSSSPSSIAPAPLPSSSSSSPHPLLPYLFPSHFHHPPPIIQQSTL